MMHANRSGLCSAGLWWAGWLCVQVPWCSQVPCAQLGLASAFRADHSKVAQAVVEIDCKHHSSARTPLSLVSMISVVPGAKERWWSLRPWRSSQAAWTWLWATCSRCPCLSRGVWPDGPWRSLPTLIIWWKGSRNSYFSTFLWKRTRACVQRGSDIYPSTGQCRMRVTLTIVPR